MKIKKTNVINIMPRRASYPYVSTHIMSQNATASQTSTPGEVIKELRAKYGMSRKAFATYCTKIVEDHGLPTNKRQGPQIYEFNIVSYESWHTDPRTGELRPPCCPKIDKLMTLVLAKAKLTGESFEEAWVSLTGYKFAKALAPFLKNFTKPAA